MFLRLQSTICRSPVQLTTLMDLVVMAEKSPAKDKTDRVPAGAYGHQQPPNLEDVPAKEEVDLEPAGYGPPPPPQPYSQSTGAGPGGYGSPAYGQLGYSQAPPPPPYGQQPQPYNQQPYAQQPGPYGPPPSPGYAQSSGGKKREGEIARGDEPNKFIEVILILCIPPAAVWYHSKQWDMHGWINLFLCCFMPPFSPCHAAWYCFCRD